MADGAFAYLKPGQVLAQEVLSGCRLRRCLARRARELAQSHSRAQPSELAREPPQPVRRRPAPQP